jgi:hypothetical protein
LLVPFRRVAPALALCTLFAVVRTPDAALAARPEPMLANKTDADAEMRKFRLSFVTLRTFATALSFAPDAELTYNPSVATNVEISPRYFFTDRLSLALSLDVTHEFTNNDFTRERHESYFGDTRATFIARDFARIPGIDVDISASVGLQLPTSKWSIGDGMLFAIGPSVRLSRVFPDVLGGLTIGYSARFTKLFHRTTTSELASSRIPGCVTGATSDCESFTHSGFRNVSFRLAHGLDVALGLADWCFVSLDLSAFVNWLYPLTGDDPRISHQPLAPTDERHSFYADLGVSFIPWSPLEIRVGFYTFAPQLAPDSSYYFPGVNRFSTVYLDLRFDIAGVMSALR